MNQLEVVNANQSSNSKYMMRKSEGRSKKPQAHRYERRKVRESLKSFWEDDL